MNRKDIIKYWLTACEDLQKPKECNECSIHDDCLKYRTKIFGRDVLMDKEYRVRI